MTDPVPQLTIKREAVGDGWTLWLSGELDIASAGVLDTTIAELCADGSNRILLEMADLAFMDSTGVRSLLVGHELCSVNDCEMLIGSVSPQVARLFEVSGLGEKLPRRASAAEEL
ncbi:MAG TPA: STAS domain-containing protein [Solirubrobacteraceae bacterium]|jgi:anti-anti-sigma factor|nr:STAS domain-containing protein [Solirubrobacteraceae bacterium]